MTEQFFLMSRHVAPVKVSSFCLRSQRVEKMGEMFFCLINVKLRNTPVEANVRKGWLLTLSFIVNFL